MVSNAFIAQTNWIRISGMATGSISGRRMCRNRWPVLAPSTAAASKTCRGRLCRPARKKMTMNGIAFQISATAITCRARQPSPSQIR